MDDSSDIEIVTVSTSRFGSFQAAGAARPAQHASNSPAGASGSATTLQRASGTFSGQGQTLGAAAASTSYGTGAFHPSSSSSSSVQRRPAATSGRNSMQVIDLSSDDSDDEVQIAAFVPARSTSAKAVELPSSDMDDLPAPYVPTYRRSVSATGGAAASMNPSNSTTHRQPTKVLSNNNSATGSGPTVDKGKGKARSATLEVSDDGSDGSMDPHDRMIQRLNGRPQTKRKALPGTKKKKNAEVEEEDDTSDEEEKKRRAKKQKKTTTKASASTTAKEAKRLEAVATKQAKEDAKQDKLAIAKANILRTGDKSTIAEVTVHVSGSAYRGDDEPTTSDDDDDDLYATAPKKKRKTKKKASKWVEICYVIGLELAQEACEVEAPEKPRQDLGCEGAIRWTRLCDKKWDDDQKMFLPLAGFDEVIVEEDSRLIFMSALDISKHVANSTLEAHLNRVKALIPPHVQIFFMHYGLDTLYRTMVNAEQATYRETTRMRLDGAADVAPAEPKTVGIGANQPSKEKIQYELLRVQATSGCMLISVDKVADAVFWIKQLTYDISQKPYLRHRMMHKTSLGTVDDNVISGKDLLDTYIKILASIKNVTEAVAKGIAKSYPTLRDLYEGWAALGSVKEKQLMLVGIGKGNNVNGTATDRAIGARVSEAIYKVMTSHDPSIFL